MSLLRKRSQDTRANRLLEHEHGQPDANAPPPPTASLLSRSWSKLLIAVVFLILVWTVLLSSPLHRSLSYSSLYPSSDDTHLEHTTFDQRNQLSPERYVYRKPAHISYQWNVTSDLRRPDGVLKRVYLINGVFPGPTIECRSGDRLTVHVDNSLDDEDVSIHWHGLSMRGANEFDGAIGITNQPIRSGKSFTYDFQVDESQSGTFWYHSHHQNQRADGLYGAIIVHGPKSNSEKALDAEHLLMIGDWYHRSGQEALEFYSHPGAFGNEPVPDSIVLNGFGAYNCSNAVPARPIECDLRSLDKLPAALTLDPTKRNVVRIINVGSYAGIGLSSPGTHLTPLAVDGGHQIVGKPAKSIHYLQPGERVNAVIELSKERKGAESMLEVSLETTTFKYPNPALTPTHMFSFEATNTSPTQLTSEDVQQTFDLQKLEALTTLAQPLPTQADQTLVLYAKTQILAHLENVPKGFINHTSWKPQIPPLRATGREAWDQNQFVPKIQHKPEKPLWVDIVLNNLDEESHPFHLHGYDFWVLATYSSTVNWGSYNPFEDFEPPGGAYNLLTPVKKDTVYVPRRGYAVLRFRADNPGFWMFHCHVLWHQASGMVMALQVGD